MLYITVITLQQSDIFFKDSLLNFFNLDDRLQQYFPNHD